MTTDKIRVQYTNHTEFVSPADATKLVNAVNAKVVRKRSGEIVRIIMKEHGDDTRMNSRHLDSRKATFTEQLEAGKLFQFKPSYIFSPASRS